MANLYGGRGIGRGHGGPKSPLNLDSIFPMKDPYRSAGPRPDRRVTRMLSRSSSASRYCLLDRLIDATISLSGARAASTSAHQWWSRGPPRTPRGGWPSAIEQSGIHCGLY